MIAVVRIFLLTCLMVFFSSVNSFSQLTVTVTVSVKDVAGKVLTDAYPHMLNQSIVPQKNHDGTYRFVAINQGFIEMLIKADGYASKVVQVQVEKDTLLDIVLDLDYKKLDEVVISVEKKETTLYQSASSVSHLSGKQVTEMRLWKLADLSSVLPNTTLSNSGDNRNVTGIRGLVSTSYEQAVATYVDGVAQFNLDTYIPQLHDIERIEVIRGAQGTLYGRNAMGGVINITTKQPQNKTEANAMIQLGNFGQRRASGALRGALVKNKLWGSVSFLHDGRNGIYTNGFTGSDYDKQQQNMFNAQLRYQMRNGWSLQADIKQYKGKNNGAFPLVADLKEAIENPYQLSQNKTATMHDRTSNASLVIKHNGQKVGLSLQTAFQNNYRYYDNVLDADFSEFDIVGIFNNYGKNFNKVQVLTNEFRISSAKNNRSKLEWNAGAFHFIQKSPTKQATVFGNYASFIGVPDNNFSLISINTANNQGLAGYGQMKYAFNKKWSIEGGMRIDTENKKMTVSGEYEKSPGSAVVTSPESTSGTQFAAVSPRLSLQYKQHEKQLFYAGYSRGFRTGGLSGITSDPSQLPLIAYKPEYSNMFEVGAKGKNTNNTLRYGFALFYNTVTNIQAPELLLPDAVTIIRNAGRMKAYGIETELLYKPLDGFTLQYNGGLTNTKYTSLKGVSDGNEINLDGKVQVFTPASTHFMAAQYQVKAGNTQLMFRLEYKYTGDQYFDLKNQIQQKGYGLLNTRIALQFSQYEFSIWGRNLGNQKYFAYAYDFGAAHLGEPRMLGGGFSWKL